MRAPRLAAHGDGYAIEKGGKSMNEGGLVGGLRGYATVRADDGYEYLSAQNAQQWAEEFFGDFEMAVRVETRGGRPDIGTAWLMLWSEQMAAHGLTNGHDFLIGRHRAGYVRLVDLLRTCADATLVLH